MLKCFPAKVFPHRTFPLPPLPNPTPHPTSVALPANRLQRLTSHETSKKEDFGVGRNSPAQVGVLQKNKQNVRPKNETLQGGWVLLFQAVVTSHACLPSEVDRDQVTTKHFQNDKLKTAHVRWCLPDIRQGQGHWVPIRVQLTSIHAPIYFLCFVFAQTRNRLD